MDIHTHIRTQTCPPLESFLLDVFMYISVCVQYLREDVAQSKKSYEDKYGSKVHTYIQTHRQKRCWDNVWLCGRGRRAPRVPRAVPRPPPRRSCTLMPMIVLQMSSLNPRGRAGRDRALRSVSGECIIWGVLLCLWNVFDSTLVWHVMCSVMTAGVIQGGRVVEGRGLLLIWTALTCAMCRSR